MYLNKENNLALSVYILEPDLKFNLNKMDF